MSGGCLPLLALLGLLVVIITPMFYYYLGLCFATNSSPALPNFEVRVLTFYQSLASSYSLLESDEMRTAYPAVV